MLEILDNAIKNASSVMDEIYSSRVCFHNTEIAIVMSMDVLRYLTLSVDACLEHKYIITYYGYKVYVVPDKSISSYADVAVIYKDSNYVDIHNTYHNVIHDFGGVKKMYYSPISSGAFTKGMMIDVIEVDGFMTSPIGIRKGNYLPEEWDTREIDQFLKEFNIVHKTSRESQA